MSGGQGLVLVVVQLTITPRRTEHQSAASASERGPAWSRPEPLREDPSLSQTCHGPQKAWSGWSTSKAGLFDLVRSQNHPVSGPEPRTRIQIHTPGPEPQFRPRTQIQNQDLEPRTQTQDPGPGLCCLRVFLSSLVVFHVGAPQRAFLSWNSGAET